MTKHDHVSAKLYFTKKMNFLKKNTQALAVILVIVAIGVTALIISHASTPSTALEPESGELANGAIFQADSSASGNSYVQFSKASGSVQPTPSSLDSVYKTLAFDDEFTGSSLSTNKWETCVWYTSCNTAGDIPDGSGGTEDPADISVNNGLALSATSSTPTVAESWGNGWIDSAPYYVTPNGNYYVEIKAKMPVGAPGLWPALVLYEDGLKDSSPAYAEMDILEAVTEADAACPVNTITGWQSWHPATGAATSNQIGGNGASGCNTNFTTWNTYGIAVSSTGSIQYYFNGDTDGPAIAGGSNATEGMFINLAMTTGGGTQNNGWAGIPTATTPSPSTMDVAYVRVFTP